MSFRSYAVALPLLAGLVAFPSCVVTPGETEGGAVATAASPIKGGYDDANDTNVVNVVWMAGGGSFGECTGSLIAPNLVLTARHCVADITGLVGGSGIDCSQSKFTKPDVASNFFVSTKQYLSQNPLDYKGVTEVITPEEPGVCGTDVALLVLGTNVPDTEAKPLIPRVDSEIAVGEQYSAIGFGATDDVGTGSGQRRRRDNLFVACVNDTCDSWYVSIGKEWEGDQGICQGDSGGPSIDLQNRVIGVTSRGLAGCMEPVYGYVFGWADWIKQNTLRAAELGGYAAPTWATGYPTDVAYSYPVGDACGEGTACASGACLGDATGDYCTRICNDLAPCPEGYKCATVSGAQYCQKIPAPVVKKTETESGGCSVAADPTKPVPWRTGAAVAALVGLGLWRRRRASATVTK